MKLLIFSDSHGNTINMERAIRLHADADYVIHLGDGSREFDALRSRGLCKGSFVGVAGNYECYFMTAENRPPRRLTLELDGVRIMLTHGHDYDVKASLDRLMYAAENEYDLVLFGHTHRSCDEYLPEQDGRRALRLFNPGSIGHPPFGRPSYGLIELRDGGILPSHGYIT